VGTLIRRFHRGGASAIVFRAALLLLCFFLLAVSASGQSSYFRYLRWIDNSTDPSGGFVVHVQNPDGSTEDVAYSIDDPSLSRTGNYLGTFFPVSEGESCFSVSRYVAGGLESGPSRTWCWYHDEPELTSCHRSDLTKDGVVSIADWSLFVSAYREILENFGKTCD